MIVCIGMERWFVCLSVRSFSGLINYLSTYAHACPLSPPSPSSSFSLEIRGLSFIRLLIPLPQHTTLFLPYTQHKLT